MSTKQHSYNIILSLVMIGAVFIASQFAGRLFTLLEHSAEPEVTDLTFMKKGVIYN